MYKLLIQEILISIAYFGPLSFIAIFLSSQSSLNYNDIAMVLLIGSVAGRAGRILFASFIDKLPINLNFTFFNILGFIGYLLLANSSNFVMALIGITLIGFFYGSSALLIRVLTSVQKSQTNNLKYAKLHVFTNLASISPLLINIIFNYNQKLSFILVAFMLFFMAIYSFIAFNNIKLPKQNKWIPSFISLIFSISFYRIYFLSITIWFIYAQVFSLAPVLLANKYHLSNIVWLIPFINGLIVVLLSIKINKKLSDLFSNLNIIKISVIISFIGFMCFLINSMYAVFIGVVLFSITELLFIPTLNSIYAEIVSDEKRVAMFAINALLMATGEGLGFYFGTLTGLNDGLSLISMTIIFIILAIAFILSFSSYSQ